MKITAKSKFMNTTEKIPWEVTDRRLKQAGGDFLARYVTKPAAKRAFNCGTEVEVGYDCGGSITWPIRHQEDGSWKIGCMVFSKRTVAIIRKWAGVK